MRERSFDMNADRSKADAARSGAISHDLLVSCAGSTRTAYRA
jgi:hypothetical protein